MTMSEPLKIAVAGLGRMGWVHARNIVEIARETGAVSLWRSWMPTVLVWRGSLRSTP